MRPRIARQAPAARLPADPASWARIVNPQSASDSRPRSGTSQETRRPPDARGVESRASAFRKQRAAPRYQDFFFRFLGAFLPFLRAFERAMAIACLRLFTLPPLPPRPLLALPRL